MTQNTSSNSPEAWEQCQAGEILELKRSLVQKRSEETVRRRVMASTLVAATLLLCVGVGYWSVQPKSDPVHGNIACSQVKKLDRAYLTNTLDVQTAERVRIHLQECKSCQEHYETLTEQLQAGYHRTEAYLASLLQTMWA